MRPHWQPPVIIRLMAARSHARAGLARRPPGAGRAWRVERVGKVARETPPRSAAARSRGKSSARLLEVPPSEELGDLDRVERRALAKIVADAPDIETAVDRRI